MHLWYLCKMIYLGIDQRYLPADGQPKSVIVKRWSLYAMTTLVPLIMSVCWASTFSHNMAIVAMFALLGLFWALYFAAVMPACMPEPLKSIGLHAERLIKESGQRHMLRDLRAAYAGGKSPEQRVLQDLVYRTEYYLQAAKEMPTEVVALKMVADFAGKYGYGKLEQVMKEKLAAKGQS